MYSVELFLKSVHNLQTKYKLLEWLQQHDAAHPNIGLEYRNNAYQMVYIY